MSDPVTGPSPDVAATVESALHSGVCGDPETCCWAGDGDDLLACRYVDLSALAKHIAAALAETPRPAEPACRCHGDDRPHPPHQPCDKGCQPDWHRDDCAIYLPARPAEPEQDDSEADQVLTCDYCHHQGPRTPREGECGSCGARAFHLAARRAPRPERAARDHGLRERVEALLATWDEMADRHTDPSARVRVGRHADSLRAASPTGLPSPATTAAPSDPTR